MRVIILRLSDEVKDLNFFDTSVPIGAQLIVVIIYNLFTLEL